MGVEELRRTLSGHRLLLLDTMVFSYHLSAHPRYAPLSRGRFIALLGTVP